LKNGKNGGMKIKNFSKLQQVGFIVKLKMNFIKKNVLRRPAAMKYRNLLVVIFLLIQFIPSFLCAQDGSSYWDNELLWCIIIAAIILLIIRVKRKS